MRACARFPGDVDAFFPVPRRGQRRCSACALAQTAAPATQTADTGRDIIVTASPIQHDRDDTPAISAKVDAEDILKAGGASISDALAKVPGIAATGFATGASRPIIRGMDATRVRILEDGLSSSDVSDIGPDHGMPIDPLSARSIEVVRGAGTLRYGSQAIGGVVNVLNDRVPMHLSDRPFSGEVNGTYGTVSDLYQGAALVDATVGDLALHADGFGRHEGNYDTRSASSRTVSSRASADRSAGRISSGATRTAMSARRSRNMTRNTASPATPPISTCARPR